MGKYVNTETGELMASEFGTATSINVRDDNKVIISSTDYVIIDSNALNYIRSKFNDSDMAKILDLCNMPRGSHNLLYDKIEGQFHTKKTLSETMDFSRNTFNAFMNKLHRKSIIYYLVGYEGRNKVSHIMLNPTLARKSKTFDKECVSAFKDLSSTSISNTGNV